MADAKQEALSAVVFLADERDEAQRALAKAEELIGKMERQIADLESDNEDLKAEIADLNARETATP